MFNIKNKLKFLNSLQNRSIGGIPFREIFPKIGMILALIIIIPLMFPSGRSFKYTDLAEGSIATKKVIAPFDFSVLKLENELKEERKEASEKVPAYFSFVDSVQFYEENQFKEFLLLLQELSRDYIPPEQEPGVINEILTLNDDSLAIERTRERASTNFGLNLSKQDVETVLKLD